MPAPDNAIALVAEARSWDYIREISGRDNRGLRVESIQHFAGGTFGDSWCYEMFWVWLDRVTKGRAPIPRGISTEEMRIIAVQRDWVIPVPELACGVLSLNELGHAHHIALCTEVVHFQTIAGNTSADGESVKGVGVFEHPASVAGKVFFRIPL